MDLGARTAPVVIVAQNLPRGTFVLCANLAAPCFVRAEVVLAAGALPLPLPLREADEAEGKVAAVPPPPIRLSALFAVDEPALEVRLLAVAPDALALAAASVVAVEPWSTLAPDWRVGPLRLPPRQRTVPRIGAGPLAGWEPRVRAVAAEAVWVEAGGVLVCGECGVLELCFDPPLARGRWRIAGEFLAGGRPALVEPRLLRPAASSPLDALAVLRRRSGATYAAEFALAAPMRRILFRPRELAGRVEVPRLGVRRLHPVETALGVAQRVRVPGWPGWRPVRLAGRTSRAAGEAAAVSIVTATRDAPKHLARFLETLAATRYAPFDLTLIDNGTTDLRARGLLAEAARRRDVRVLADPRRFNFAVLSNLGAHAAGGRVLVFANNDIAFDDPDWLGPLVAAVQDPAVGLAAARLLYPDGRVQHAGLVLAGEARIRHAERFLPASSPGYQKRQRRTVETSAVTGALVAIRADLFHALGGFDPRFGVLLNDADLSLRVREAGLTTVVVASSVAVHHESASIGPRRADDLFARGGAIWTLERAEEARLFRARWAQVADADPCYPPGRDPLAADFRRRL